MRSELAALLSQTIGIDKADELIAGAARDLSLGQALTTTECLNVLEHIAARPGIGGVGVSARCAKIRVLLRWGKDE